MYSVIGLGGVGCKIGKLFSKYPQYNIVGIDDEESGLKDHVVIPKREKFEDYETHYKPVLRTLKKKIKNDVIFVLSGASAVSAVALRVLQEIKDKNRTYVYAN